MFNHKNAAKVIVGLLAAAPLFAGCTAGNQHNPPPSVYPQKPVATAVAPTPSIVDSSGDAGSTDLGNVDTGSSSVDLPAPSSSDSSDTAADSSGGTGGPYAATPDGSGSPLGVPELPQYDSTLGQIDAINQGS